MSGINVLSINIFFHPDSTFGSNIFTGLMERLYSQENPDLEMDFKVPAFKIPYYKRNRQKPNFDIDEWKNYNYAIAIVVLDSYLTNDASNLQFLDEVIDYSKLHPNIKVLPVLREINIGNSEQAKLFGAINIMRPLALLSKNNLGVAETLESVQSIFYIEFYHFLIKLFLSETKRVKKVTFFLSHTKYGGVDIMTSLRRLIHEVTQLDDYVDVYDIEIGQFFEEEIQDAIKEPGTMFITVLTDQYSTRTVCRMEVLFAKKHYLPILTVSALEKLEKRSFPYLNNTPVIRWQNTNEGTLKVIEVALREYLRTVVVRKEIDNYMSETGINADECICFPPELLTLQNLQEKFNGKPQVTILYPEPILDKQEMQMLNAVAPNIQFVTPWQV